MKRVSIALLLLATVAVPVHIAAQGASTAKPATAPATQAKPAAPAAAGAPRVITIDATDQMKFSVTVINAKPGESLEVVLKGVGAMPKMAMAHNFVLLKDTAKADTFANDAVMVGPAGNYIPAARKGDVLASTTLVGAGETAKVAFKAPTKPGTYVYLCSFPGHFAAGMKGTLVVK